MVDKRWAINRDVLPLATLCKPFRIFYNQPIKLLIINYIDMFTCSVMESSDDVASSYTKIRGFFKIALAIAILCFSPPSNTMYNYHT